MDFKFIYFFSVIIKVASGGEGLYHVLLKLIEQSVLHIRIFFCFFYRHFLWH